MYLAGELGQLPLGSFSHQALDWWQGCQELGLDSAGQREEELTRGEGDLLWDPFHDEWGDSINEGCDQGGQGSCEGRLSLVAEGV